MHLRKVYCSSTPQQEQPLPRVALPLFVYLLPTLCCDLGWSPPPPLEERWHEARALHRRMHRAVRSLRAVWGALKQMECEQYGKRIHF